MLFATANCLKKVVLPKNYISFSINFRSKFKAVLALTFMFSMRDEKKCSLRETILSLEPTAKHTVPTGFSGVPPVGPATPEVATA